MRVLASTVILMIALSALAGCFGTQDDDEEDPASTPGSNGPDDPGPDNDRTAAPPPDQRKDSPDEITRRGQYALLPKRDGATDASWAGPSWDIGDWWEYEHRHHDYHSLCDDTGQNPTLPEEKRRHEVIDTAEVTGTDPDWSVPVYTIEKKAICVNQPTATLELNFSQDHRTLVYTSPPSTQRNHGHIEHETLFPLEDGKRWTFLAVNNRMKVAEVTHRPDFQFDGESVEAWEVAISWERGDETRVQTTHYGVEAGWMLRQEKPWVETTLELVDYHDKDLL